MSPYTKSDLTFTPTLAELSTARGDKPLTVFAGANNSGKSLVLKWLKQTLGRVAYMVGTNRFYHVYHFSTGLRDPNQVDQLESQFNSNFYQEQYNYEQNYLDLNSIIVGLGNRRRSALFDLCGQLIGNHFELKKVDEENDLSNRYIDMDGQNLSVGSTGTRLLMTILGICMDDRYSTILIDEPELGLGPRVQQSFSAFLQDAVERNKYFPHLNRVFVATHSHLFLARNDITNNFVVAKSGKDISLTQIATLSDFHRLQFNLLGNSLEAMFFPSAIVVVEGKTDCEYIERVLELRFPGRRVTVIPSGGDVKRKVAGLREAFGDLARSPFRDRLFVVLDSVHQPGLVAELEGMGIQHDNVIQWEKNGIEYVYPAGLVAEVFSCAPERVGAIIIADDRVELNGIIKTKNELKVEILRRLDSKTPLPEEMQRKLLKRISAAID
jgi:predicted ATP-dependent endonuclease of OLD family